jgi:hypothetical protein
MTVSAQTIAAAVFAVFSAAPVHVSEVAPPWLQYRETCFSKGERTEGMNKVCYYTCPSGGYAITIASYQVCPVSVQR